MKKYIEEIEINLNGNIKDFELAEALRILADNIESGCVSGLIGWSDIGWYLTLSDEEYDENEE